MDIQTDDFSKETKKMVNFYYNEKKAATSKIVTLSTTVIIATIIRNTCYPTCKISMVSVKCAHKCEENENAPFSMHYNLVAGICPFCNHFPFTSIRSLQKLLFTAIFFPTTMFSSIHRPPSTQPSHILKYVFSSS